MSGDALWHKAPPCASERSSDSGVLRAAGTGDENRAALFGEVSVGQTLGQAASFRQTAPGTDASPGFAAHTLARHFRESPVGGVA